jgi:beta-glucosidase
MSARFVVLRLISLTLFVASLHAQQTLTDAQITARANALIAKMTPAEKAGQLIKINGLAAIHMDHNGPGLETSIANGSVGSLAYITDPAQINHFQHIAMEQSRLKIPLLVAVDMVHGERTIFPVPLAMAATWDPALVEASDAIEARESAAVGLNWTFAPMLDIARDPRWGRIVEGAGEDPVLGAAMAVAQVRGLQGGYIGAPGHILAGPKHFAGYGGVLGGRDYAEVNLSDSDMWNVYLPPFAAAIKVGAGNVMTAYMPLNGVPAAANKWLLTDVLRNDWGFKGFAVSDANNINALVTEGLAKNPTDAAALALNAGEDMESGFVKPAFMNIPAALSAGLISTQTLDNAVRRILEIKIRLGLFEHPYTDESKVESILADPAHRVAARTAAEHAAVLLRNENHTLPFSSSIHSIAVIGPLADSKLDTLGPWILNEQLAETVTVLEGLRARAGQGVKVEYAVGLHITPRKFPSFFEGVFGAKKVPLPPIDPAVEMKRAVDLAAASDVAVLVLGETQDMDGEAASSSTLALPGDQQALLEAVAATGKPVVLLLMSARPLELRWASTHVPAIMDIWYPGTQGGAAVANLLFGDANSGGKLPITWPRDVGQVPFSYDNRLSHQPATDAKRYWNEESTPLYPFGYGLSYTTFAFDNLRVQPTTKLGEPVTVSVDVHNMGKVKGEEVAELYIHQRYGSATRPARELKAFKKVFIAPGAMQTVTFTLGREQMQYWSTASRSVVLEPSTFDIWVGPDSTATLTKTFNVTPN